MTKSVPPPHPQKLTRAEEFRNTLIAECRLSGRHFLLHARLNALSAARLGLIASRKVARNAVDRNRGKRLVREAFRAARSGLPKADLVVQLKNDLRESGNRYLRNELGRLLREVAEYFGPTRPRRP